MLWEVPDLEILVRFLVVEFTFAGREILVQNLGGGDGIGVSTGDASSSGFEHVLHFSASPL